MVDRTRIPTSMYPSGYTPDTPDGEVTPVAMTKSGSGEPILKEMLQDYPCGDEPGCGFRSSPLNIYPIARDSSVVLYVEKGCANFTWESDNEWATFGSATTSARYNTLTSSADEGQDTVVTVTDSNGLEVTITVLYSDASSCCEDPPALSFRTVSTEIADCVGRDVVVFIAGGCPPFTWEVSAVGGTAELDYEATNSRRNRVTSDTPCVVVTVTDACSQTAEIGLYTWTEFDNYEFDNDRGLRPWVVNLATDYYAVVYNGPADDGQIKTFHIPSATGVITEIDDWEYQASNGDNAMIINISDDVYAITDESGYIYTVRISDVGVITKSLMGSESIGDGANRTNNYILNVYGDVYAVFWDRSSGRRISTFSISNAGAISALDTWTGNYMDEGPAVAIKVAIDVYAVVKLSDYRKFTVYTFEIANNGTITKSVIDSVTITVTGIDSETSHSLTRILEVGSNVFVITHTGSDTYHHSLITFGIANDGTIDTSEIDTLPKFAASGGGAPAHIVYSGSGDIYYVVYAGTDGDGFLRSVKITSSGKISDYSPCGAMEFEIDDMNNDPFAPAPKGDMLPIFYDGPDNDGWIRTMNLGA